MVLVGLGLCDAWHVWLLARALRPYLTASWPVVSCGCEGRAAVGVLRGVGFGLARSLREYLTAGANGGFLWFIGQWCPQRRSRHDADHREDPEAARNREVAGVHRQDGGGAEEGFRGDRGEVRPERLEGAARHRDGEGSPVRRGGEEALRVHPLQRVRRGGEDLHL